MPLPYLSSSSAPLPSGGAAAAAAGNSLELWLARVLHLLVSSLEPGKLSSQIQEVCLQMRAIVVAPLLRVAVVLCMIMSVMLVTEKIIMGMASLYGKVFGWRPRRRYKCDPLGDEEDMESGNGYPMVLVQIPMYNERQVYKLSIGAACSLTWPSSRLIIQVLDDSTDLEIKRLVEAECKIWESKGLNIKYEIRDNRHGYKAGALKEGMKHSYVGLCDHVAIFDADFQPEQDFLLQTIPFLFHNPEVGLVQARWKFVNSNECMMTRIQEMSMDYHFKVEQESGSTLYSFFGFNGTAGIWRISALTAAGGWKDRTTVEDMDLAVRATLCGWKFIYLGDVKVKSELPSTFKAYRNQQYRWSCGPANLFTKMYKEIIISKQVGLWRKINLIYSFFLVRRVFSHIVTFSFFCIVIPFSVFVPEVEVTSWGVVYIPTTITLLNSVGTPSSLHLLPFWILFENVMAMHRSRAVLAGLLELGKVNEWVVTKKLGSESNKNGEVVTTKPRRLKISERFSLPEIGMSIYLIVCATYDMLYGKSNFYFYIYPQAISFFILGIGYAGTFVPSL